MENFTFWNPTKIIFGKDTIPLIIKEIKKYNYKKILMLAGSGSIKLNGVYEQIINTAKSSNIILIEKWGVRPNPILSHAESALELARKEKVEAILAVGGGSVIDEAKAIAAGFYAQSIWDLYEHIYPISNALPIFTVLTLSGTGSEMNVNAVLTNEKEKKKWFIGSPLLYPKASVIDPSIQMSLPWHQTVNGAIDAITHTQEFYFMGSNQEISLSIDEAIIKTIIKSVDELSQNEKNYDSRANLAWSATIALNGLSGIALPGGDWASHRIEHAISALHPEVAHGAGLAVVMPAWIKYIYKYNEKTFSRWAHSIWKENSIETAIEKMKEKYRSWSAPVSLKELGIQKNEIQDIAKNALLNGNVGNIKSLSIYDIIKILEIAY